MSVHPADSEIFGALWGSAEMRALFSDATHLQLMLDVEAALARAEAKLGLVPQSVAEAITRAARVKNLRMERIAEGTREAGVPVPALVSELGRAAGEAGRTLHPSGSDHAGYFRHRAGAPDVPARSSICGATSSRSRAGLQGERASFATRRWPGAPHSQQAVPTTFGLKCAVWASPLAAHVERLD